jgi:hypothetical protein
MAPQFYMEAQFLCVATIVLGTVALYCIMGAL